MKLSQIYSKDKVKFYSINDYKIQKLLEQKAYNGYTGKELIHEVELLNLKERR